MTSSGRQSAWRRALRLAGTAFIVVAVVLLAWGFAIWRWGDPVTALYTRHAQGKLEHTWVSTRDAFRPAGLGVAAGHAPNPAAIHRASVKMQRATQPGDPVGRLRVPALDLDVFVVAGTDHTSLRKGPGWDMRTFLPGQKELTYIAGHRTTFGAPFGHIDRLRPGDPIEFEAPYGTFHYRVTETVVVPATDLSRLESHHREVLVLQACHPRFSARERYLAYARLVSVTAPR